MVEFLEFMLLFLIIFRWLILLLGVGLIIFLIRLRRHKKDRGQKWLINLSIVVVLIVVLFSIYQISGIDFGVFPEFTLF